MNVPISYGYNRSKNKEIGRCTVCLLVCKGCEIMPIKIEVDQSVKNIEKKMGEMPQEIEKANKDLAYDLKRRTPAQVKKAVREVYAVDASGYRSASISPKVVPKAGGSVELQLEYKGRNLSLKHFHQKRVGPRSRRSDKTMAPGSAFWGRPDVIMVRQPKRYGIYAEIIKGKKVVLGGHAFITTANGATNMAFRREDGASRYPIKAIKTLGVPEMITGRARPKVQKNIDEMMEKRYEHMLDRVALKLTK